MDTSKRKPKRSNENSIAIYKQVLSDFGQTNPEYGDLASRYVCLFSMMLLLEMEYPRLSQQYEHIKANLYLALDIALTEVELTNRVEMEALGLV